MPPASNVLPLSAAAKRPAAAAAAAGAGGAVRHFARFQLLRLLGKSSRSMLWLVEDPRVGQELVLALPRHQLPDDDALRRWHEQARRATRSEHPALAHAIEVGDHDRWPYITYERAQTVTLAERLSGRGLPAADLVPWCIQALQGLAFAHQAGAVHGDLQAHFLSIGEAGQCRVMGLGVDAAPADGGTGLQAQRLGAERDVLALGLVLHAGLAGEPALGHADVGEAIAHMAPLGRDTVRLPRAAGQPIAEPLRAIVNRATERHERLRYRSARTFERALSGWLRTASEVGGGPIALLLDRMRSVGLLPAMPGGAARAARFSALSSERVEDLAEVVLGDVGLCFELLRLVNSASVRGAMVQGNGAILTVRRAITMLGLDGARRAANGLRPWPGTLNEAAAHALLQQLDQARQAGRIAQRLRPAGYDAELVYLLALMQRLGRLAVFHLFPDDAVQIQRLMRPVPANQADAPDDPGMGEEGAAYAVLGVDLDTLGAAVGKLWGLDDAALHMARRMPMEAPVRHTDHDADTLRCTASCGNEVADALALPERERNAALHKVLQRYGRALGIEPPDLLQAIHGDAAAAAPAAPAAAKDTPARP